MTNIENAAICLDHFLRTEKAKMNACEERNEESLDAVDFSEAEKALSYVLKEARRENKAYRWLN